MSRQVAEFGFRDLGVDSPSYFQGAGTAFTDWDEVFVGTGDNAYEAASEALEYYNCGDINWTQEQADEISATLATFDELTSAHDVDCMQHADDCEVEGLCSAEHDPGEHEATCPVVTFDECSCHDECDLQHYVALYVRYQEEDTIECASHDLGLPCICPTS